MVTIDDMHSEIIVEGGESRRRGDADKPDERRVEELRAVVRELMAEELERFLRTQVAE